MTFLSSAPSSRTSSPGNRRTRSSCSSGNSFKCLPRAKCRSTIGTRQNCTHVFLWDCLQSISQAGRRLVVCTLADRRIIARCQIRMDMVHRDRSIGAEARRRRYSMSTRARRAGRRLSMGRLSALLLVDLQAAPAVSEVGVCQTSYRTNGRRACRPRY